MTRDEVFMEQAIAQSRQGMEAGQTPFGAVVVRDGAVVAAAVEVAKQLGPGKRVVVILCDTGERYFSMEQYFEA